MPDRTQQARERAAEIIEALDEQDITWHSQGPWEHLGDACRDGRIMADDVLFLIDRVAALETALGPDAAGRPLPDLLRSAAEVFNYNGDGPLADCLRWKADEIDAALAGGGGQTETCAHDHHHFDRTLCACGVMHHYCDDCGHALEPCDAEPPAEGGDRDE